MTTKACTHNILGLELQTLSTASEAKTQCLNPYWYEDDVPGTGHVITDTEHRQMHGCGLPGFGLLGRAQGQVAL